MNASETQHFEESPQNTVRRIPERGSYDRKVIFDIIDSTWISHVGIANDVNGATVIPKLHARLDDSLIFHGARASRLMKHLGSGEPVSISFTIVDGLVLAKSLFHHSMNYRSAVAFGRGEILTDANEIDLALKAVADKVMPGRWDDARRPDTKELAVTAVVRLSIDTASAKIRAGSPADDDNDLALSVWSGVLPIRSIMSTAKADEHSAAISQPDYVEQFRSQYNAAAID